MANLYQVYTRPTPGLGLYQVETKSILGRNQVYTKSIPDLSAPRPHQVFLKSLPRPYQVFTWSIIPSVKADPAAQANVPLQVLSAVKPKHFGRLLGGFQVEIAVQKFSIEGRKATCPNALFGAFALLGLHAVHGQVDVATLHAPVCHFKCLGVQASIALQVFRAIKPEDSSRFFEDI